MYIDNDYINHYDFIDFIKRSVITNLFEISLICNMQKIKIYYYYLSGYLFCNWYYGNGNGYFQRWNLAIIVYILSIILTILNNYLNIRTCIHFTTFIHSNSYNNTLYVYYINHKNLHFFIKIYISNSFPD